MYCMCTCFIALPCVRLSVRARECADQRVDIPEAGRESKLGRRCVFGPVGILSVIRGGWLVGARSAHR